MISLHVLLPGPMFLLGVFSVFDSIFLGGWVACLGRSLFRRSLARSLFLGRSLSSKVSVQAHLCSEVSLFGGSL